MPTMSIELALTNIPSEQRQLSFFKTSIGVGD